jgi:hypothetical protein
MVIIALAAVKGAAVMHKKIKQSEARLGMITALPSDGCGHSASAAHHLGPDWWGARVHDSYQSSAHETPAASAPALPAVLAVAPPDVAPYASTGELEQHVTHQPHRPPQATEQLYRSAEPPRPALPPIDDGSYNHAQRSRRYVHKSASESSADPVAENSDARLPPVTPATPATISPTADYGSFNHAVRSATTGASASQHKPPRKAQTSTKKQAEDYGSFNHAVRCGVAPSHRRSPSAAAARASEKNVVAVLRRHVTAPVDKSGALDSAQAPAGPKLLRITSAGARTALGSASSPASRRADRSGVTTLTPHAAGSFNAAMSTKTSNSVVKRR